MKRYDTVTSGEYLEIMQEASVLGDEQLLSEVYARFGERKSAANSTLYYLLKAIEIRERIGVEHFSSVAFDYYTASTWLYEIMDYRNSAHYGVKGILNFKNPQDFLFHYVLALDITGAAFLRLSLPDSAILYYRKLKDVLDERKVNPTKYQKSVLSEQAATLWENIALGGMGQGLILKGQYDTAYSLLQKDLEASVEYGAWTNAALAQSGLGFIDATRNNHRQALARFRQARHWALPSKRLTILIPAIEGLSSAFAALNINDSALYYYREYNYWQDSLQTTAAENRLDLINTRLEYEKMQSAFARTQEEVASQERLRNAILSGIAALTVIALLLYNRRRLQRRLKEEQLERAKETAEAEAERARQEVQNAHEQLQEFVKHIAEKNQMIEVLEAQLSGEAKDDVHTQLQQFTILTDDDWSNFKRLFNQKYPDFYNTLSKAIPDISPAELRFSSLFKLNLTHKEMAAMLGITDEAVRKQSYRLRKKLETIHPGVELKDFIARL